MFNYKIYTSDAKVVAVSTFARKPVRGIAKCDPEDTFSVEAGKELAIARCDLKIAEKREKHARKKLSDAKKALLAAQAQVDYLIVYHKASTVKLDEAKVAVEKVLAKL
jgi:hypothetical protein